MRSNLLEILHIYIICPNLFGAGTFPNFFVFWTYILLMLNSISYEELDFRTSGPFTYLVFSVLLYIKIQHSKLVGKLKI